MGLLGLKRLMSKQRERNRRRQMQIRNQMTTKVSRKKAKRSRYSGSNLHEMSARCRGTVVLCGGGRKFWSMDIWCHIRSRMSLKDAASSACVSRAFLCSWRCHPNLNFSAETLCLKRNASGKRDKARHFIMRVDQILKNHSGTGVKTLNLGVPDYCKVDTSYLNRWLQIAITPGIEEVTLFLPEDYKTKYTFPCSLLFGGCGNSIQYLRLAECAFHPPVGFNCLRSLAKLHLYEVFITGEELESLIANCFALEHLQLMCCGELVSLKIPFSLERLSFLRVSECDMLQAIESKAPNLIAFKFYGDPVDLSLGESSQMKKLDIEFSKKPNSLSYAITRLPSTLPNIETLNVTSAVERVNTPMVADKFLNLKYLGIYLGGDYEAFSPAYDYLSLVSFLDASPALETFILTVNQDVMKHDSVFGDASHLRQIPGHKHDRLRKVQINGFCSAKSMVELACHILENASLLESLTVDTIVDSHSDGDVSRCSVRKKGRCSLVARNMIMEAHKALRAVNRYIVGRVPASVKLNVGEPCSRCHAIV